VVIIDTVIFLPFHFVRTDGSFRQAELLNIQVEVLLN